MSSMKGSIMKRNRSILRPLVTIGLIGAFLVFCAYYRQKTTVVQVDRTKDVLQKREALEQARRDRLNAEKEREAAIAQKKAEAQVKVDQEIQRNTEMLGVNLQPGRRWEGTARFEAETARPMSLTFFDVADDGSRVFAVAELPGHPTCSKAYLGTFDPSRSKPLILDKKFEPADEGETRRGEVFACRPGRLELSLDTSGEKLVGQMGRDVVELRPDKLVAVPRWLDEARDLVRSKPIFRGRAYGKTSHGDVNMPDVELIVTEYIPDRGDEVRAVMRRRDEFVGCPITLLGRIRSEPEFVCGWVLDFEVVNGVWPYTSVNEPIFGSGGRKPPLQFQIHKKGDSLIGRCGLTGFVMEFQRVGHSSGTEADPFREAVRESVRMGQRWSGNLYWWTGATQTIPVVLQLEERDDLSLRARLTSGTYSVALVGRLLLDDAHLHSGCIEFTRASIDEEGVQTYGQLPPIFASRAWGGPLRLSLYHDRQMLLGFTGHETFQLTPDESSPERPAKRASRTRSASRKTANERPSDVRPGSPRSSKVR